MAGFESRRVGTPLESSMEDPGWGKVARPRRRGSLLASGVLTMMAGFAVVGLVTRDASPVSEAHGAAPQENNRKPEDALKGIDVHPALEATLFAAEPQILNITNIDVDERGRVWACEVVNYRRFANPNNPVREAGDRILILEDTNGDGKADKVDVFYQGRDIDSAMGIAVLGDKVIVSSSPNILVFTKDDKDKVTKKELLFTKTGAPQHDHSAHSFVYGPDGRLYWNFGNTGQHVHDKEGKLVHEAKTGRGVIDNGKPYFGGMIFRCDMNGKNFEVLAHNFRNNYETAIDSYGTLWQSDNDDDGNRGVRINYVMEYGNYGYLDEKTGAGWRTPRTNLEAEIPLQHWHLNDPGVVPNLLQTGAGSPTGICVYEGRLLPKIFWDQMIHCDAGPSVVRAYPVKNDGAGYKAEIVNVMHGARDNWFRPADVCVAPDGSLFVSDWYDPGVGGHRQGDVNRGRIFRVAPPKTPYKSPRFDFRSPGGALKAFANSNHAVRYRAAAALTEMWGRNSLTAQAVAAGLHGVIGLGGEDAVYTARDRARALWLLGRLEKNPSQLINTASKDKDPNIRIVALRLARQLGRDLIPQVTKIAGTSLKDCDPSPQVRREAALALRLNRTTGAARAWAQLALRYVEDPQRDRWALEALGVGAEEQWDAFLAAFLQARGESKPYSLGDRDIIWRSRAAQTPLLLSKIIADPATPTAELPRCFRAFDFQTGPNRESALIQLAFETTSKDAGRSTLVTGEALARMKGYDIRKTPAHLEAINRILAASRGTARFVELVDQFQLLEHAPALLALATEKPDDAVGVQAVKVLLSRGQTESLRQGLTAKDEARASGLARALVNSADGRAVALLRPLLADKKQSLEARRQAVRGIVQTQDGAREILNLIEKKELDKSLLEVAAFALHSSSRPDIRAAAAKLFPPLPSRNNKPLPTIAELVNRRGNVRNGRLIYNTTATCAKCHVVNDQGKDIGPDLSEIGNKLSRTAMYESILFPSAGISHNYETSVVLLNSGTTVTGIITSRTKESITLKAPEAPLRTFQISEIEEITKQNISLMPADLTKVMTENELVDVVEYLMTLKKKEPALGGKKMTLKSTR